MQTNARTQNLVFGLIVSLYIALIVYNQDYEYSRLFHLCFLILLYVCSDILISGKFAELLEKYLLPNNLKRKVLLTGENFDESVVQCSEKIDAGIENWQEVEATRPQLISNQIRKLNF